MASSDGDLSTFEISASYIGSSTPDFLDMYKLKDEQFGLRVSNTGGAGTDRLITLGWSPVLKLNVKNGTFSPMLENIGYKLYLGYNSQSLDLFSSLCMLEAADAFD